MSRLTHLDSGAVRHPAGESPRKGVTPAGEQRESFAAILGDVTQEAGPASTAAARRAEHAGKTAPQGRQPQDEDPDIAEAGSGDGADGALPGAEALPASPPTPPLALRLAPASDGSAEPAEEPVAFPMPKARSDDAGQEEDFLSPLARIKAYVLEQATYFQPVQALATKSERSAIGDSSSAEPSLEPGDVGSRVVDPAPIATGEAEETSADGDAGLRAKAPSAGEAAIARPEPAFSRRRTPEFSAEPPPARFSELISAAAQEPTEPADSAASESRERPAAGAASAGPEELPHGGSRAPVTPGRGDPLRATAEDRKLANPAPRNPETAPRSEGAVLDAATPLERADRATGPAVAKPKARAPALPGRSNAQQRSFTIPGGPFAKTAATRTDTAVDRAVSPKRTEGIAGQIVSESRPSGPGSRDRGAEPADRTAAAPSLPSTETGGATNDAGLDRIPPREPPTILAGREDQAAEERPDAFFDTAAPRTAQRDRGSEIPLREPLASPAMKPSLDPGPTRRDGIASASEADGAKGSQPPTEVVAATDDTGVDQSASREPPGIVAGRENQHSDAPVFFGRAAPRAAPQDRGSEIPVRDPIASPAAKPPLDPEPTSRHRVASVSKADGAKGSQPPAEVVAATDDTGVVPIASREPQAIAASRENQQSAAPAFFGRAAPRAAQRDRGGAEIPLRDPVAAPPTKPPLDPTPTDRRVPESAIEPDGRLGLQASTEVLGNTDAAGVEGAASRAQAAATAEREGADFKSYGPTTSFDRNQPPAAVRADRTATTPVRPPTEIPGAPDDAGVVGAREPQRLVAEREGQGPDVPATFDRTPPPAAQRDGGAGIPVRDPVASQGTKPLLDPKPTDWRLADPLGSRASTEVLGGTDDAGVGGAASRARVETPPGRGAAEFKSYGPPSFDRGEPRAAVHRATGGDRIAPREPQSIIAGRESQHPDAPAILTKAPAARRDGGPEIPVRAPVAAPKEADESRLSPIARDPAIPADGGRAVPTRSADVPVPTSGHDRFAESIHPAPLPTPATHVASGATDPIPARRTLGPETAAAFAVPARPASPVAHSEGEAPAVPPSGIPAAAPVEDAAVSGGQATQVIGAGPAVDGPIASVPPRVERDHPAKVADDGKRLAPQGGPRQWRETPPRQGTPVAGPTSGARLPPRAEAEPPFSGAPARRLTDSDTDVADSAPLAQERTPPGAPSAGPPMFSAVVNPPDGRTFAAAREGGPPAPRSETGSLRATPDPTRLVPNDIKPQIAGKEAPVFQPLSHAATPPGLRPDDATHLPTRSPPSSEPGAVFAVEIAAAAIPTQAVEPARSDRVSEVADDPGQAAAAPTLLAAASDSAPPAEDNSRSPDAMAADARPVLDAPIDGRGRAHVSEPPGFTPVSALPAPQLQRIADVIGAAAAEPALLSTSSAPGSALPVRTMTIELHPTELGTVTVKLRLVGGELSVALHASRPETARLLKREEDSLSRLLAADGHQVEIAGIETGPPSPAAVGQPAQAGGSPASAGAPPQAAASEGREAPSSNQRSGGDAPKGERRPDEQSQPKGDDGDKAPSLRPGNIYV